MYKLPFLRAAGSARTAAERGETVVVADTALLLQAIALPATAPLAALARRWHGLGPVLWLWRAAPGHAADLGAVAGWNCIHRIEPDGICEALRFYRDDGRELARLYLLPDSDYLAWEQLLHCVPCGKAGCEDHRDSRADCLMAITPERVAVQALELLARN